MRKIKNFPITIIVVLIYIFIILKGKFRYSKEFFYDIYFSTPIFIIVFSIVLIIENNRYITKKIQKDLAPFEKILVEKRGVQLKNATVDDYKFLLQQGVNVNPLFIQGSIFSRYIFTIIFIILNLLGLSIVSPMLYVWVAAEGGGLIISIVFSIIGSYFILWPLLILLIVGIFIDYRRNKKRLIK